MLAHLDPKRPEIPPTFKDLDDALDLVSALFSDYEMLILNKRTHDWAPALQGDWHAPLRAPLFWPPSAIYDYPDPGA
jgi:hypothetical protein